MLRNDAYYFSRLGVYVERADNTARVLDVKYHVLLPEQEAVGGSVDYFQWTAILRSVSALTAYHWVYRESIKPWNVADLLILRSEMPRSLLSCYDNIVRFLDAIGNQYGRQGPAQRHARNIKRRLENASIKEIFQSGLHEFVDGFVTDNNQLGARNRRAIFDRISLFDRRDDRSPDGYMFRIAPASGESVAPCAPLFNITSRFPTPSRFAP